MLTIEYIPMHYYDAIIIHFTDDDGNPHNIIVDGGEIILLYRPAEGETGGDLQQWRKYRPLGDALGMKEMPVRAVDGLRETIKSFAEK